MQSESDSESVANVVRVDKSGRRRYRPRFKEQLVERCLEPGASVSRLSIEAGVNTNLVRKWVRQAQLTRAGGALVPVTIDEAACTPMAAESTAERAHPAAAAPPARGIEIELRAARIVIGAGVDASQIAAVIGALR